MPELIVTDEQARMISEATAAIPIRDSQGHVIGHAVAATTRGGSSCLSSDQVAGAEKRLDSDGLWYTTAQVMEHLRNLDSE
jgi:hypothetical protein